MTPTTGPRLIAQERMRQVCEEGWTAEHDDEHNNCELVQAAVCYLDEYLWGRQEPIPHYWPWDQKWWKPSPDNRIKDLIKAGALIAAEIDRLQRITP